MIGIKNVLGTTGFPSDGCITESHASAVSGVTRHPQNHLGFPGERQRNLWAITPQRVSNHQILHWTYLQNLSPQVSRSQSPSRVGVE